jgi:hypothetical protein
MILKESSVAEMKVIYWWCTWSNLLFFCLQFWRNGCVGGKCQDFSGLTALGFLNMVFLQMHLFYLQRIVFLLMKHCPRVRGYANNLGSLFLIQKCRLNFLPITWRKKRTYCDSLRKLPRHSLFLLTSIPLSI